MVGEQIIFKNAEFCFCMYFIHLQVPYINNISSKAMPTFGQQQQQELSPLYPSLILVGVVVFIGLYSCFVFKRWKYIVLKNLKVHYRSKKYHYILAAFIISYLYTFIMVKIVHQNKIVTYMSYCAEFYFIVIVISFLEYSEEHQEQGKYFMLHHAQGLTFVKYFIPKMYCFIIISLILAILNTVLLNTISNQYFGFLMTFSDNLFLIYAFSLSLISSFGMVLIFSFLFDYIQGLRYLFTLFIIDGVLLCSLQDVITYSSRNFNKAAMTSFGFYNYCVAFSSSIDSFQASDLLISLNFEYLGIQIGIYYGIYFILMFYRTSNFRLKKLYEKKQKFSFFNSLLDYDLNDEIIKIEKGGKWDGFKCCCKSCKITHFKDVNIKIKEDQLFVILGNNNLHKNDLLDVISGVQTLSSGKIYRKSNIKLGVCHSIFHNYYPELSFQENICYFANMKDIKFQNLTNLVTYLVDQFYFDSHKSIPAKFLSSSNLKKLDLACSFVGQNDLLVLDEPTNQLTETYTTIFWNKIKKIKDDNQNKSKKTAIVMGTYNITEARFFEKNWPLYAISLNLMCELQHKKYYRLKIQLKDILQQLFVSSELRRLHELISSQQADRLGFAINYHTCQIYVQISERLLQKYICPLMALARSQPCCFQWRKKVQNYFMNKVLTSSIVSIEYERSKSFKINAFFQLLKRRLILFNSKGNLLRFMLILSIQTSFHRYITQGRVSILSAMIFRKVFFVIYSQIGYSRFQQNKKCKKSLRKRLYGSRWIYQISWFTFDAIIFFSVAWYISDDTSISLFFNIAYSAIYLFISYILASIFQEYAIYLFSLFFINGNLLFYIEGYNSTLLTNLKYFYFSITYTEFYRDESNREECILIIYMQLLAIVGIYILYQVFADWRRNKMKGVEMRLRDFNISQGLIGQQQDINSNINSQNVLFIANNISKTLAQNKLHVNNFCIILREGDIYGLLGNNSSGKSTIFNILAGFISSDEGYIHYNTQLIQSGFFTQNNYVGICPPKQFIDNELRVWHVVEMFGKIKGLKKKQIQIFLAGSIFYFDVKNFQTMLIKALSEGHIKLLCIILAFIGNPKVLMFDQPTSGLFQSHKFKFWDLLTQYVKKKKAAVFLTSNNPDQIESYCTKMGLLIKGKLVCVDNPKKIVERYASNYKLIVKYKRTQDIPLIKATIEKWHSFFQFNHKDHSNLLIYDINIIKTNYQLVAEDVVQRLLKEGLIEYFEFYKEKVKHIIKRHFSERSGNQNLIGQDQL